MEHTSIRTLSHCVAVPAAANETVTGSFAGIGRRVVDSMRPAAVSLLAIGVALCSFAGAQTAHFVGSESAMPVSGVTQPQPMAVAVDAGGSVYISDFANNQVVKETLTSSGYVQTTVASGLGSPGGIAIDGSGNVYIADYGGKQLFAVQWNGSAYGAKQPLLTFGIYSPVDVAVDPYNVLFFTSWGDPNVYAVSTVGGAVTPQVTGLAQPLGVAWETTGGSPGSWTGNLFVSDYTGNTVLKQPWNGSSWGSPSAVSTTGLLNPARIAVDSGGSVYVADLGNNRVVKAPWSGTTWGTQTKVQTSGLLAPRAVAVDGTGNVYIADFGNSRTLKETFGGLNFGPMAVGAKSPAHALFFAFDTAGSLGSTAVLTQGTPGLDFADAHTGNCAAGSAYNAGDTCAINVTFTPRFAGPSYGASVLKNGSGIVIATSFVYGVGSGAQVNFLPGAESTVSNALSVGVAADAAGNLYVVDYTNNQLLKETLQSGGGYAQSTVATGLLTPQGVALDGSGNLYIADFDNNRVLKETLSGSGYTQSTLVSGTYKPVGIAVDGSGNVYFTDWNSNRLWELPAGSGTPVAVVSTGLSQPSLLAMDSAGDIFIANYGANQIVEVPWTASGFGAPIAIITSGLSGPFGVAVDGNGDIYISNSVSGQVLKESLAGGSYTPSTVHSSPLSSPLGIALDGGGNLYIADSGHGLVLKEAFANPPSLSFAPTEVTAKSSDSPQTVAAVNIGNENLLFSGGGSDPSYPSDFPKATSDTCSGLTQLAPGAACDLSVNFIPTWAGSISENLVLTDNNLNVPGATQSISLSGTAYAQIFVSPSTVTFGDQVQGTTSNSWTMTLNNTGNVSITGIHIDISEPTPPTGATPPNFAYQSGCGSPPLTLSAYTTCNILVSFTPSVTGAARDDYSATLSVTDASNGNPVNVSLSGTGTAMNARLDPNWIDFGSQTVGGASQTQTATLTNAGSGTLTISNIAAATSAPNSNAFAIGSTTCGALPGQYGGTLSPPWTLGPNSNCTITMTFSPSTSGSYSGALTVADNGLGGTQSVNLNGTGAGQNVFLSTSAIGFSNQTVGSTGNAWTVTFNNTSDLAVTIPANGISIVGANPGDFAETNNCLASLPANSNCNIYVTFQPHSANYLTATLQVLNSVSTQTASLSGTGTAATVALAPNQLNFGSLVQGQTSGVQQATLTNTSDGLVSISSVGITSGNANFSIPTSGNGCISPLAAHATCTIAVVFNPTATGNLTGMLTVADSATGSPRTVSLVGTGTSNAVSALFSPGVINFGSQTLGSSGNAWGVTLNNTSSVAMSSLVISTGSNSPFTISSSNCGPSGSTLAANSTCSLQLAFAPHALGNLTGALTATYTGGSLSSPLTGTGIAPTVSLAPNSLNFGNQTQGTQSAAQSATLTNTSAGPVIFYSATISGSTYFAQTNNCPTTAPYLQPNQSCTISVTFNPSATGNFTGALLVSDNGGNGTQSVTLTGKGTSSTPSGYFSPPSITFGNQTVGSTSNAWGMTLNNNGSVPMIVASVLPSSSEFAIINNNCLVVLAAGSACSFQVTFTPTATGARLGAVTANYTGGSLSANLTGTGIAPTVSVAPASLNFGNVAAGSQSSDQVVNLTNTSAGPLSNIMFGTGSSVFLVDASAGNCGILLSAYTSCSIHVYFKPSAATSYNGTLTVSDSAAGGQQTVSLTGTGLMGTPTIATWPMASPITYGTALNSSTLSSGSSSVPGAFTWTAPGTKPSPGTQPESVTFTPTDIASYNTVTGSVNVLVNKATPTTSVSCLPNPVTYLAGAAQTATCTATVGGGATGSVTMYWNGNPWATQPLSAGSASLTGFSTLSAGSYAIRADYSGDANFNSTTASATEVIAKATPVLSWATPAPIDYGTALSGTQLNASAGGVSGTFTFKPAAGTVPNAGTQTLHVDFTPFDTTNYWPATQVMQSIVVNKATPTIGLTPSQNPVNKADSVTFTATVAGVNTSTAPTGAVSFFNGSTQLGPAVTLIGGVATYTSSALSVGTASITAVYAGDANFVTVSSGILTEVVDDLKLAVIANPGQTSTIDTVTAPKGGTATVTFTVTPSPGPTFASPVQLSASGLPAGATGVFSPTALPAGSGVTTVTFIIQLPAAQTHAMVDRPGGGAGPSLAGNTGHSAESGLSGKLAPLALALLLLPLAGRLRRAGKRLGRLVSMLLVLATLGVAIGLSGCQVMSGMLGTSYNVTVTATSGNMSDSTSFTLKVQ